MGALVLKADKELAEARVNQKEVCDQKSLPHFAPFSGRCCKCSRDIYQNYEINGRNSTGYNSKEFITGCPHCSYSYCD